MQSRTVIGLCAGGAFILHWTAAVGHVGVANTLLSHNVEVDAVDFLVRLALPADLRKWR